MTSTITETALFLSRSVDLSILTKATILVGVGLAAASLAARSRAAVRHVVLAATFGTLATLPLIVITAPRVPIEIAVSPGSESAVTAAPLVSSYPRSTLSPGTPESGRPMSLSSAALVRFGWIAGGVILLAPLAFNLWWLRRLRRDGLPWPELRQRTQLLAAECGVRRSVEVLLHEEIPAPLTCGVWRPAIVLPCDARQWGEIELRCALLHELEHVRRGDWAIQLAARGICACYWFHPLVWVAWRRLCLEAERACDDAVIRNEERTDYAGQLVSLARRMSVAHAQPAVGMANRSDLSRRISALLDGSQRRGRAGLLAAACILIAAVVAVLAFAPLFAVAEFPSTHESGSSRKDEQARRSTPLDRALYEAAEDGDVSTIDRLLAAGANVNCALRGDGSPLLGAARNGRLAAARLLLDRGADPNMPVRGDGNPLIMASREGHAEIIALLLDRGANINEAVPDDETALIQASGSGHQDAVRLLVSRGADVNARVWVERASGGNGEWRSPLSVARRRGQNEVVAYLLSAGARE